MCLPEAIKTKCITRFRIKKHFQNVLSLVYQGFRPDLCKRCKMIVFGPLLTTFEASSNFDAARALMKIG